MKKILSQDQLKTKHQLTQKKVSKKKVSKVVGRHRELQVV